MDADRPNFFYRLLGLMRNFWVNLLAVALGILIAVLSKETAKHLIPVGKLYLALLTMTVVPIVFSAIAHGLGQLIRSGKADRYMGRLVAVFSVAVILGATLGVLGGVLGGPGSGMGDEHHKMLGELLLHDPAVHSQIQHGDSGMLAFVVRMVPANIFRAFTRNQSLAVIFVSILIGVALGVNRSEPSGRLLEVVRGIYETFFKILDWVLYGLPLGLCCLIAGQIAAIGTDYLFVLSKMIGIFYLCCGVMCVIYAVVMRLVTGATVAKILGALKDALTLAFVASNSLVAMPMALQRLEDDLKQPRDLVELVVPLGVVMNRQAYPLLFALTTVFVSQVYNHPLGFFQLVQVSLAAALAGMAAIGPAASVAPMIALILLPLGLPAGLALATLVETSAMVTPMVAMTHLFGSCATATLIGAKEPLMRSAGQRETD